MNRKMLKGLRLQRGLTQREMAELIGVSRSAIEAAEQGRRPISDWLRARVAKEFNLTDKVLVFFDNYEKLGENHHNTNISQ